MADRGDENFSLWSGSVPWCRKSEVVGTECFAFALYRDLPVLLSPRLVAGPKRSKGGSVLSADERSLMGQTPGGTRAADAVI